MNFFRQLFLVVLLGGCLSVLAGSVADGSNSFEVSDAGMSTAQQKIKDTVVIPFEYKQSALYHPFTLEVIDSVISILLKNNKVTLGIEGYAFPTEGSDTICYYLSLNRALFIRDYVLGRGVDSNRIISIIGFGRTKPKYKRINTEGVAYNCRAEIMLNYPEPPKDPRLQDRDRDGIVDSEDKCPDEFGNKDRGGCPNDAVIVPFEVNESALHALTYRVLDSVIALLSENPSITISIEGHAHNAEGVSTVCFRLSNERADIVKNYLLSRRIPGTRIDSIKGWGSSHPLNAGDNPKEILRNSRAEIFLNRH